MASGKERRVHPRLPLNMVVQFRLHDMNEFLREFASNISVGGMFVRTLTPHAIGSTVYLQFSIEGGEKLIEGMGTVVHVNPPEHPSPGIGVEFVTLDPESRVLIERIISERRTELDEAAS